jgi:molybdopterin biosynthesis enzyme
MLGDVMCATRHTNTRIRKDEKVAATRAIPLLIDRSIVDQAVTAAQSASEGVLRVLPLKKVRVGVMITGDEVFHGRIQDKFEPVIRRKVSDLDGEVLEVVFLPDDDARIAQAAGDLALKGVDVIITTGGMSVDPDDRTRFGLKKAGAREMVYGAAVLPGAMFMMAYLNDIPVLGIPACGMFATQTIFDLVYPRVLTGEKITRKEIAALGHGGLCLSCDKCTYPHCPFGK